MGWAYVLRYGETGNRWKVGKAKDREARRKALAAASFERLIPYADIETDQHAQIETFIKHRLQHRRWLGGEGIDQYEVEQAELDEVIAAAERWNTEMLPRKAEVARLTKMKHDGTVLVPGDVERELHRDLMRLRQIEKTTQQEMERVEAELKVIMGSASRMDGIVTWQWQSKTTFDLARFKKEQRPLHEEYRTKVIETRPFDVRW